MPLVCFYPPLNSRFKKQNITNCCCSPDHPRAWPWTLCLFVCVCLCVCSFVTHKGTSKRDIALFCLPLSIIKRIHTMWPSGSFSFCKDPFIWGFLLLTAEDNPIIWQLLEGRKKSSLSMDEKHKLGLFFFLILHLAAEVYCLSYGSFQKCLPSEFVCVCVFGSCPSDLAALLGTGSRCEGPEDVTAQRPGPCGESLWPLWNFSEVSESPLGIIFPFPSQIWTGFWKAWEN